MSLYFLLKILLGIVVTIAVLVVLRLVEDKPD